MAVATPQTLLGNSDFSTRLLAEFQQSYF